MKDSRAGEVFRQVFGIRPVLPPLLPRLVRFLHGAHRNEENSGRPHIGRIFVVVVLDNLLHLVLVLVVEWGSTILFAIAPPGLDRAVSRSCVSLSTYAEEPKSHGR